LLEEIKTMKIAIDDTRTLMFCDIIFRTPYALFRFSQTELWNEIKELYLDHDLGVNELTGLRIIALIYDNNIKLPDTIKIITANHVGRKNIIAFLENDCGYIKQGIDKLYKCNMSKEQFTVTTMVSK
jgi:hypothetical protein